MPVTPVPLWFLFAMCSLSCLITVLCSGLFMGYYYRLKQRTADLQRENNRDPQAWLVQQWAQLCKHLAQLDAGQQRIVQLAEDVSDLKTIFSHKPTRGAFGESQLHTLVADMLPGNCFQMQYTLPTGARADCAIFFPEPTGTLLIDAKFPLEAYQHWCNSTDSEMRQQFMKQLKIDMKKHITDIAQKYILPGTTTEGAILFLPAESVFSDVHAHCPETVAFAQKQRVWLTSPNTLLAVLTTAQAVWKHHKIQEESHIIQAQLGVLATEFSRFDKRMRQLTRHIAQSAEDTQQLGISAKKITEQFERLQLHANPQEPSLRTEEQATCL